MDSKIQEKGSAEGSSIYTLIHKQISDVVKSCSSSNTLRYACVTKKDETVDMRFSQHLNAYLQAHGIEIANDKDQLDALTKHVWSSLTQDQQTSFRYNNADQSQAAVIHKAFDSSRTASSTTA